MKKQLFDYVNIALIFITIALMLASCSEKPTEFISSEPIQDEVTIVEIVEKTSSVNEINQVKTFDQCNSASPFVAQVFFSQTENQYNQSELVLSGKVGGEIGVSPVAKVTLEGAIEKHFSSGLSQSKEHQEIATLEIPAHSNQKYSIVWQENRRDGIVTYIENGETKTADFSYRIGIELVSTIVEDLICPGSDEEKINIIPSATPDYSGKTIIAIADFYKIGGEQIQVDHTTTSDIVDETISFAQDLSNDIDVINLGNIVKNYLEAEEVAKEFENADNFILIYGGTEILENSVVVEFTIYSNPSQVYLPFDQIDILSREHFDGGLLRIEWPSQIKSAISYIFGHEAYSRKDYSSAINLFSDALSTHKPIENANIHFYLANSMFFDGSYNYQKIVDEYEKANSLLILEKDKDESIAIIYFNIGVVCYINDNLECAEKAWENAIEFDPTHYEAHFNLGILTTQLGNWERAKEIFNNTIKINPERAEGYNSLGTALYFLNNLDAAIIEWDTAFKINPDYCLSSYNLGSGYLEKERLDEAENMAKWFVECEPMNANGWELLGVIFMEMKENEEAEMACLYMAVITSELGHCSNILGTPSPH